MRDENRPPGCRLLMACDGVDDFRCATNSYGVSQRVLLAGAWEGREAPSPNSSDVPKHLVAVRAPRPGGHRSGSMDADGGRVHRATTLAERLFQGPNVAAAGLRVRCGPEGKIRRAGQRGDGEDGRGSAGGRGRGVGCLGEARSDVDQVGCARRTRARNSSAVAQSITALAASGIRSGSDNSPSIVRNSSATSGPNFIPA